MRTRTLAVLAAIAIGVTLGGVAALLDADSHPHDDSDEMVRDSLMRGVDDARRIGRRLTLQLDAIRGAGY